MQFFAKGEKNVPLRMDAAPCPHPWCHYWYPSNHWLWWDVYGPKKMRMKYHWYIYAIYSGKIGRYFVNVNSIQVVLKVTRDLRWHSSRKLLSSSSVARINRRKLVSVTFNIGYGVKLNKPKDWNVNHLATISPATAVRKGRTLDKKLSSIQTISQQHFRPRLWLILR